MYFSCIYELLYDKIRVSKVLFDEHNKLDAYVIWNFARK